MQPITPVRALVLAATSLVALNSWAAAQDLLIRNAEVFDPHKGEIKSLDVLVEDGRFTQIGHGLERTSASTLVIDADGQALVPGLIDVHTHWTGMNGATRASIATDLLVSGVTTATDFHAAPEAYADLRSYHAQIVSPHVFFAARMSVPYGHGTAWTDQRFTKTVFGPEEARRAAEKIIEYKPDAIKVFADGWRYGSGINLNSINIDAFSAIVETAHDAGLPVFSHTVTVDGGKLAARAGVNGIVHAIQDRTTDPELVQMLKREGVYYSPTLTVYEPFEDEMAEMGKVKAAIVMRRQEHSRANMSAFVEGGVKVAMGTDQGIDNNPFGEASLREMELMVDFGLSPTQALTAATLHSAELLGLADDRGAIEVGKRADFLLIDGKPWQDISHLRNVDRVFVDGTQVVSDGVLSVPQGPDLPPARLAKSTIDDFEQSDVTGTGARRGYDVDRNHPRSHISSQTVERDSDAGHALHVAAEMRLKDDPFAYSVLPFSPAAFVPVDASGFEGIRMDVRGDGTLEVVLSGVSGKGTSEIDATPSWTTIEIPFDSFQSKAGGAAFSADQLTQVAVGKHAAPETGFWFELDNVEFYATEQ